MSGTETIFEVSKDGLRDRRLASALCFGIHTQGGSLDDFRLNARQAVHWWFDDDADRPAPPEADELRERRGACAVKLPRSVSGVALESAFQRLGYEKARQCGSHFRITTRAGGAHHEVIPLRGLCWVDTLMSNLKSLARHYGIGVEDLSRTFALYVCAGLRV